MGAVIVIDGIGTDRDETDDAMDVFGIGMAQATWTTVPEPASPMERAFVEEPRPLSDVRRELQELQGSMGLPRSL